ncbi:MAG: hypothetical protein GY953_35975 [bacterium]|nr:hypothetical protein [bacterium]
MMAAQPAIGVAVASGSFHLDEDRVSGNGTLFEGSTVVTGQASSQLRLTDGIQMQLASSSQGTVYRDRLVLERGTGQLENARDYRIEAMGLEIVSEDPQSAARVKVDDDNLVEVAALRGALRVTNGDGILLAALPAGRALAFDATKAGASAPSAVAGCVKESDGHYLLSDETAGLTVELRGEGLEAAVGHQVAVTGVVVPSVQPVDGASQVLQVSSLKQLSSRCSSKAAAATAAGAAAVGAGAAAGIGGATTAVIAGVVVAAAGTGAAIGLTRGGEEEQTISR